MLNRFFTDQLYLGLAQSAAAGLVAFAVVLLARSRKVHLESEAAVALVRGLVQIVAVGSVLVALLRGPQWTSVFLLMAMVLAAAAISAKRAKGIPGSYRIAAWSISCGAGSVIAVMTCLGVIDTAITALIPVGSMLIANAMNTTGLALNRFRSDVLAHVGEIETALALGAKPNESIAPYVQSSFESSLIPAIDSLRSLGIVWIPGMMAGMLVSGSRPIYAAIYQFVVMAMIFASSGLTSLLCTMLVRSHAFTDAEQLLLRGESH
ncbi:ABC transporter permease [Geomonas silvestris]|uniref:ABC transporter permease n=1 Tax=Geomonas silvestris TaxID=2740184 RepID=A0A6V8MDF3_9BACT|nr:ABC transporter permease [Geomonas silvestris]GFO58018.1 ABC transporter permease [Geomonas silvestris]